jgi:glycosyltransferase involved in cell wall biosynthesis
MLIDIVNEQCRTEQVWIIVLNNPVDDRFCARIDPAVKVFSMGRKPGSRSAWPLLRLNWLVSRIRPDIVHAHCWSLVKTLFFRPCKTVLTVHTTRDVDSFDRSIARYDRVFAISEAVAEDLQRGTSRIRPKLVVNGIRCTDINTGTRVRDGLFRIVQIARLEHRHKGQDVLLRAVARVCAQPGGDRVQMDLIGEGASRHYLEGLTRDLRIEKSVRFRGTVLRPRIYNELCGYDLLVQPSHYEGFGLVVAEAMAARVPVLVSDLEGPRDIIERGRFGFLFRPGDDADCARQIQCIREMKESAAMMELVSAAREHVLEKFDVKRTAREYLQEYRDDIEQVPTSHPVPERWLTPQG